MLKVLIAEDDLMIADMAEEILVEGGFEVCGIARTVTEGVALGRLHKPDLAVIDMRLADGGMGTEIAAQLSAFGRLGVLYATGNALDVMQNASVGDACILKPTAHPISCARWKLSQTSSQPARRRRHFLAGLSCWRGPPSHAGRPDMGDDAAKVRKLLRQQAAIAGFGSFALRQSDLLKVLTEAAKVCAEGLSVPFSKVCRYREAENDLLIEAGFGWNAGVVGNVVSRADDTSPQGRAFITGQPSISKDLREDNNFVLPPFYAEHGIISTVDVVIKGDDRPYGILEIDNNEQHDYDQHDIDFLTSFANVLAEAVATSERTAVLQATIDQMKVLLDHKKVLAEELQHRVRNNLQLVYGMLTRQLGVTTDAVGQRGIKAIARRVSTLAQVFDHLHGSEMTRTADFASYVKSLCLNLEEIQGTLDSGVTLTCDSEPIILDLDVMTALGLVVAELVTNSYDHAFPDGKGATAVSVRHAPGDVAMATLTISDNGKGFNGQIENKRQGVGLVRRLIEQIRGTVKVESDHGTVWTIRFPTVIAEAP